MIKLARGRYRVRLAEGACDLRAAQALRALCFHNDQTGLDTDHFDPVCDHMLVEDTRSGDLVCCFRMLPLPSGREINRSYSAQYYELSALRGFEGPMVEMGRFCIHPDHHDPDILRVAWGAMTAYVDD